MERRFTRIGATGITLMVTFAIGCASSHGVGSTSDTARQSLVSVGDGLGSLWVATPDERPTATAYVEAPGAAETDLWMKTGDSRSDDELASRRAPRLERVLNLMAEPTAFASEGRTHRGTKQ